MDKPAMTEAMKASISEVLEQMFFIPVDFIAPDTALSESESGKGSITAKLDFSGSPCGSFTIQVPESLAQSVSANFLGIAPQELSYDHVTGTVLEMINMLAGGTLSAYNRSALFDLQIPELMGPQDTREHAEEIIIRVQTPENRMTFKLIPHAGMPPGRLQGT
jgi:CheY-specific phosphatase CheX